MENARARLALVANSRNTRSPSRGSTPRRGARAWRALGALAALALPVLPAAGAPPARADAFARLPARADSSARADSAALADSTDLARALMLADSLARELARGAADTLGVADSLADSLGVRGARRALRAPGALPTLPLGRRGLRLELGASTDITNEYYYEDQFDTAFVVTGRKEITTPETRFAAVGSAALEGGSRGGPTRYVFRDELTLGDKVQRQAADLAWHRALAPGWALDLAPRGEASHDRTFDRDLWQWSASPAARVRRLLGGADTDAELGLAAEALHAYGRGSEFVLDRDALTGSFALDHAGFPSEWRLGYGYTTRTFPDSTTRDHGEHALEASWRTLAAAGHHLAIDAIGTRRQARSDVGTTRDDLREGRVSVEGEAHAGEPWSLVGRFEAEALRYDRPDNALYYDQTITRAALAPRLRPGPAATVEAGPRLEWLRSAQDAAEAYREVAGTVEVEVFGAGSWARLASAAGRRSYDRPARRAGYDPIGLHTNYDFVDLELLLDRTLGGSHRLRVYLTGRLERHTDAGDDSRSLYFSVDLRRLWSR